MNMVKDDDILRISAEVGVDSDLVKAIIHVESAMESCAWRVEPLYRYLWDVKSNAPFRRLTLEEMLSEQAPDDFHALKGSKHTEWLGQQASWGPMQVMGAVARELGFAGWFPELCGPQGILMGCKLLRRLTMRHGGHVASAVAAYNAGTAQMVAGRFQNQKYVDKVMSAYQLFDQRSHGGKRA